MRLTLVREERRRFLRERFNQDDAARRVGADLSKCYKNKNEGRNPFSLKMWCGISVVRVQDTGVDCVYLLLDYHGYTQAFQVLCGME